MRWVLWLLLLASGCAALSQNSGQSGMSSAQSGNSSARTGASSAQSADSSAASGTSNTSAQSSNGSNASSAGSQASSNASNASTGSSNASNASSNQSSGSSAASANSSQNSSGSLQSSASSATPSSTIVLSGALLAGVAGGIITTVYSANQRREARLEQQQLRQLQQAPVPQPMPYKVEPIPLQPGIPGQPPPPVQPPPPPPPEFEPAPFPQTKWQETPSIDAMVLARSWLLANELQLKQDLALGAGPAIDDLAGIAGITSPRREHFGRMLQRNRALFLTTHEVTPQQAAQLMSRVGTLVMADPFLRPDAVAILSH